LSRRGVGRAGRTRQKEIDHAVLLLPVLWAGGAVVLLGGSYYVITHMMH
jgi:hypothetical protein